MAELSMFLLDAKLSAFNIVGCHSEERSDEEPLRSSRQQWLTTTISEQYVLKAHD